MQLYNLEDTQRPPNWRYLNANALLDGGAVSPPGLDRPTRRLVRLLRKLRCAETVLDRTRALRSDSLTAKAMELSRITNGTGDLVRLWELTGALTEDVAMATRLPSNVAATFMANHFDIADRLDNTSFIISQLIYKTESPRQRSHVFLQLVAYLGGAEVLGEVLHFGGRRENTNLQGISNTLARRAEMLRGLKIHLAEESVDPMDLTAVPEALRLMESQEQAASKRNEKSPPLTPLEETMDAVLKAIPFSVRGTQGAKPHPRLVPFEGGSAELRADDQLRIAAGEDLYDPEEFRSRKLPPPRARTKTGE